MRAEQYHGDNIDGFAQLAGYYRRVKQTYEAAKQHYRELIKNLQYKTALATLTTEYYGETIQILPLSSTIQQQLLPLFAHVETLGQLFGRLIDDTAFLKDFTTVFPNQVTLIALLLSHRRNHLHSIYEQLIQKQSFAFLMREAAREVSGVLDRYYNLISIDLTIVFTETDEQHKNQKQPCLLRNLSDKPAQYSRRVSRQYRHRIALHHHSMDERSESLHHKIIQDLQLVDSVISSIVDSLSRNLSRFNIQLRYMLSVMSDKELRVIKLAWIQRIEDELIKETISPYYVSNVKTVMHMMRMTIEKPDEKFKDVFLCRMFLNWTHIVGGFFRQLLEVQINDRLVVEYELKRTLCCLSSHTLHKLGYLAVEQAHPYRKYLFNTIDIVSSKYSSRKSKQPTKKSNFIRIDHEPNWTELLRVSISEQPEVLKQECHRLRQMIYEVEQESAGMIYRAQNYVDYLIHQQKAMNKLRIILDDEQAEKQAMIKWNSLIIQPHLYIVIEKDILYFSSQDGKGCLIDTINKFVQQLGNSSKVAEMVQNSFNLKQLNQIYCQYLGMVDSKLKSDSNCQRLFLKIQSKIESSLFYKWQIDGGPSAKDLQAKRQTEKKIVSLEQLDLGAFVDDEQFYIDLAEDSINRLSKSTSPSDIIGCFIEMSNCILTAMKISQPKVIMAGDAQLSVVYFLVSRYKLINLASLTNFVQVCWYEKQNFGQKEYMFTVLKSVLQILLENRQKSNTTEETSEGVLTV